MRLIDADALKKVFIHTEDAEYAKWTLNGVISEIDDMPTVDVLEQIRVEIEAIDTTMGIMDYPFIPRELVLKIIDKYKGDNE